MRRGKRMRWRHSRNTLPARRRRRRAHRRDVERGGTTYNPIEVSSDVARSGVRFRLLGAVLSALVTVLSLLAGMFAPGTFGAIFGFTVALSSFGAAVGLLMSARHEEQVHALAAELERGTLLAEEPDERRQLEKQESLSSWGKRRAGAVDDAQCVPEHTDGAI